MGKNFYIILQGSVGIMIPAFPTNKRRKNSFDNLKLFDKAFVYNDVSKNKVKNEEKKIRKLKEEKEIAADEIIENEKDDGSAMMEINILLSGETFGEYSLISNQPVQASIKCKEDCHFAILEKKDFNAILSIFFKKKLVNIKKNKFRGKPKNYFIRKL